MADRCPHCGAANPQNLPFCNECGEPIDQDLQLIMDVQHSNEIHQAAKQQPRSRYDDDDFEDEEEEEEEEEKRFPVGIAVLAAVAGAAAAWFFLK